MDTTEINNSVYEYYGERWYSAYDDPVALLRAEHRAKLPWVLKSLSEEGFKSGRVLDIGCGGGFLSNDLALQGYSVTGIDLSPESLAVAKAHDQTRTVQYQIGDAYDLPFSEGSFDIVTAMDFLEHVDRPERVVREVSRVLKPDGLFFFHTFNRNVLSHFVIIKLVEWFIKNTPKNLHVHDLFIRPSELEEYCRSHGLFFVSLTGIRVKISSLTWQMIKTGVVSPDLEFILTPHTNLSYLGMAKKKGPYIGPCD